MFLIELKSKTMKQDKRFARLICQSNSFNASSSTKRCHGEASNIERSARRPGCRSLDWIYFWEQTQFNGGVPRNSPTTEILSINKADVESKRRYDESFDGEASCTVIVGIAAIIITDTFTTVRFYRPNAWCQRIIYAIFIALSQIAVVNRCKNWNKDCQQTG